jgi:predicted outer membrane repeat protein
MSAKRSISHLFSALFVIVFILAATPLQAAYAATLTVTNCDDSTNGSLRQIVTAAAEDDTINFGLDCPATSPITLASPIPIEKNLTISGAGHDIVISGNNTTRLFNISYGTTTTLEYLTLKNGAFLDDHGGAIYDNGSFLTISHVTFDNNRVTGSSTKGGAIYHGSNGALTISDSTFSNNSAENYGGAILTNANTTVTDSTFSGNSSGGGGALMIAAAVTVTLERVTMNNNLAGNSGSMGVGGAIYFGFGTLNINNSTLSGNGSSDYTNAGGAIYMYDSTLNIRNSTIVNNLISTSDPSFAGGGIKINTSTLNYYNTILANNTTDDCNTESGLTVSNNVNNLVEVSTGCGTPALTSDPKLGPLMNNGGSTRTHGLQIGSPAIDAGDNSTCLTTDQRGISRPQGAQCDIGAYEGTIHLIYLPLIIKN